MRARLANPLDRVRVAQWICDEGTISTSFDAVNHSTYLTVGGSMVDGYVMQEIGRIIHERANNETTRLHPGWLPMRYLRIHSAEAYALLSEVYNELLGLKKLEAEAALGYFPPWGYVKGRHTTDEFMAQAWRQFAEFSVLRWNEMRKVPLARDKLGQAMESWFRLRIRRSRYYRYQTNAKTK
jgi:hypothetical protein